MIIRPRNLPQADPYFDSVVLLAPLSGEDGDTTSTDLSNEAHTMTFNANSVLDGDIRKFGFTSAKFDGTGDYVSIPDALSLSPVSSSFTVECHVRFNGDPTTDQHTFVGKWSGTAQKEWWVGYRNNKLNAFLSTNGSNGFFMADVVWDPAGDTWYHIAFVFDRDLATNETRVYVDGTQVGASDTTLNTYASFFNSTADVWVGGYDADTNDWMDGNIENVRITKGVARYTAAFTPPERAFSTTRTFATVPRGSLENPALPDVSELSLDSTNLLPVESAGARGALWNDDGTQLFIADSSQWHSDVYTASTAYDASSLTHSTTEQIGDISSQRVGRVSTDGTLIYLQDYNSSRCNSYTLSTAYDFSSLTFNQTRADQLDMRDHMSAFDFASEGDYYFGWEVDTGEMLRYDMSTPYDLSTGPFFTPNQQESMDGITTQDLSGLIVSVDGLTMWGLIQGGTEIWQWTLNTAYDLTGGTTKSGTLTLNSTASSSPYGMFSPKDRNEIWICWTTNPRIESYVW